MFQNIYYDKEKRKIHIWDDTKGYFSMPYKRYAYVKDRGGTHTSIYGDRLKKVWNFDRDMHTFESDVVPEIRTLVDLYYDSDEISLGHTRLYFDIEVEVTDGFPSPDTAPNKITSIAFYEDTMNQYYCYALDEDNRIESYKNEDVIVEIFKSEEELLQQFFTKYSEIQPTILSGWNTDTFDIPYLYHRAEKVLGQYVANTLSPINQVRLNTISGKYEIAGVSSLDYLRLYKNLTFSQRQSYRLDAIAEHELGEKKVEYEGTLNDLYEQDIQKFIDYNVQDVRLIKRLDDKLDYIDIARGICHIGHCPYEEIYWSSRYIEGAILVYCKKVGLIAPDKRRDGRKLMGQDMFEGAYVQDPQRGKHDWVYDLDVTSMYPSVMRTLNISPETKIGKLENWNAEDYIKGGGKKTYTLMRDEKVRGKFDEKELREFIDNTPVSIASNGVIYRTDKLGLIPAILTKWFEQRVEYRKLAKKFSDEGDDDKYNYFNRRQYLQKVLLNSIYGVLGLSVFRFYDTDNATAVTTTGQSLIKFTKKIANNFYNKELGDDKDYCIYIDTDSVFYSAIPLIEKRFPGEKLSEVMMTQRILEIASEVQDYINLGYDYFAQRFCNIKGEHQFQIKQELIAKSGLFIVKKRYGMKIINDNGVKVNKTMVKGLDTIRSNFPNAMRSLMKEVLEDILLSVPKDKIDNRILTFKRDLLTKHYDEIAMPTGVKKITKFIESSKRNSFTTTNEKSVITAHKKGTPVHVKASINHNDLLRYFGDDKKYQFIADGDKVKWIYLKNNPIGMETIAFKGHEDSPKVIKFIKDYADYEKMYQKALEKKIQMFYESLVWSLPMDKSSTIEKFF